ncbi:Flap endonuclease FEN-1 [Cotia virus SPAn232]|uniref:Flap endonuclease FEN-1 n=2 Tax=Cotia virus TaxID=39444 RepID=H6TA46_9POXV|nr:Flap endonuclease FEN-1 [Cotia virus SPAn232]ADT91086.2 Flap endonuclease FEN-1 [Cotia virus SPAn232]AIT70685.1 Flap endonuclease FEN-1 [Cotia virus]
MGIKNLKMLLIDIGSLKTISNIDNKYIEDIFIDTMSFYMTLAYSSNNIYDLNNMFFSYINQWNKKNTSITLFIDRGYIKNKEYLRNKRRTATVKSNKKRLNYIENITKEIDSLDISNILYDEIKTSLENKIIKLQFQIHISNSNNIKEFLNDSISKLPNDVNIIYCDGYDAEFVMCKEARSIAKIKNKWPYIISTDQDSLLFSSCDEHKKFIRTMNTLYIYIPCSKSRYLSKLVALVNGCDYFLGLSGLCITNKSLPNIKLFDDFTIENILQSIVTKNYFNKTNINIVDVDNIIQFIDSYSNLDYDIYDREIPKQCTIQEFIFSSTYKTWESFNKTLLKNLSICSSLIYSLEPRKILSDDDIKTLCNIIKNDKDKNTIIHNIQLIINIFGYDYNKNKDIKIGIVNLKDIMLCYNDMFYFNNEKIIKKNNNKIINIS